MFSSIRLLVLVFLLSILGFKNLFAVDTINGASVTNNEFAFSVLTKLAEGSNDNFNFAPLNLSLSLALTANGATGETQREILDVLGYDNFGLSAANSYNRAVAEVLARPMKDVEVRFAQSLWIDNNLTLKDEFEKINSTFYNADIRVLDLKDPLAPDHINSWIYEQTEGKIFSLIDDISEDVIMYLLSSFYFKGYWAVQFKPEYSRNLEFNARDGSRKDLIFMKTKSDKISYLKEKGFTAIGLPYGNGDVTMYFFLPDETSHIDIFLKGLNNDKWQQWMNSFETQEVVAVIPRLELNSDITFNEMLMALGMKSAFTDDAEFTSLCNGGPLISEVKQKTFLTLNEEGTEAAAADKLVFLKGGCPHVYLTHPFLYAMVESRSQAVLLLGVYQQ